MFVRDPVNIEDVASAHALSVKLLEEQYHKDSTGVNKTHIFLFDIKGEVT